MIIYLAEFSKKLNNMKEPEMREWLWNNCLRRKGTWEL